MASSSALLFLCTGLRAVAAKSAACAGAPRKQTAIACQIQPNFFAEDGTGKKVRICVFATGQAADTDTLTASAKAYVNALNNLLARKQKSAPEPLVASQF